MVIAHVLSSLNVGGGERVALELGAGQVAAGHRVLAVSLAPAPDGPLTELFRERRVEVVRVEKRRAIDVTLPLRLALLFRRAGVGIVHTHNRMPLIYAAPAAKLARARVVHTRHGPGRGTARERILRRSAGRLVDAYVAVSPELAALARELGDCPDERISVIHNGIDVARFRPDPEARRATRAALGIPRGGVRVRIGGAAGRREGVPPPGARGGAAPGRRQRERRRRCGRRRRGCLSGDRGRRLRGGGDPGRGGTR
jgi:glycosyltransferase involved in cell wall biosynthesis